MLAQLREVLRQAREIVAGIDASALHPRDAVALLDEFNGLERAALAGRALVADRAASSSDWTRSGHRSPEEWLATKTGTSYRDAANTLELSTRLKDLPATEEALREGRLSGAQANELAAAATAANEDRLLRAAEVDGFKGFKERCAKEKAAARSAEDEARRHERAHKERYHRSWTSPEGIYRYEGATTIAAGARMDAAIAAEAERVFKEAYAQGRREPTAAYRADAVLSLLTGASVDTTVVIRVDANHLASGMGVAETPAGPVPVSEAVGAILAGAFVKVLSTDGTDVGSVVHAGRRRPAVLDTAIVERDGYRCVRPGCGSEQNLEVHHYRIDYAAEGPTAYWNLATLCRWDHRLVTHGGHRLEGGPGGWKWVEPP